VLLCRLAKQKGLYAILTPLACRTENMTTQLWCARDSIVCSWSVEDRTRRTGDFFGKCEHLMQIYMPAVYDTVTVCNKWTHGPQTANGGACGLQQWTIAQYDAKGFMVSYTTCTNVYVHKRFSCVHLVSLPYMGLNGIWCSPCCKRHFWDAAVCSSSMLASAAAQSGWMVLCNCIKVSFAVATLGVAKCSRAAQSMNGNL